MRIAWGWVLVASLAGPAGAADGPGVGAGVDRKEGIRWPGEGGKRIKVALGIYVVDFARVNLREESFDMAGYLDTTWTDPSLALAGADRRGKVRRFRPGQVWAPALEFVNAVEQVVSEREGDLYADDDGRVAQRVRFSHKFQSPLRLRRFPFDEQVLAIVVAPFDPFANDLDLAIDPSRVGRLPDASVTDWEIDDVSARIGPDPTPGLTGPGSEADERFHFEVKVHRRATFYIWRVLLPMTLLVVASWLVFWFEPTNLQPQISTGLAILLSLVTFTYAIDFSLPKVAYLTFIDRYTLAAFSFVLGAIFAVAVVHRLVIGGRLDRANRLRLVCRWAFPAGFAAVVAAISVVSFASSAK